jgi:hypothetical protein
LGVANNKTSDLPGVELGGPDYDQAVGILTRGPRGLPFAYHAHGNVIAFLIAKSDEPAGQVLRRNVARALDRQVGQAQIVTGRIAKIYLELALSMPEPLLGRFDGY